MTGAEHWREAETILLGDRCDYGCPHLARAQVHVLLALAAVIVGLAGDDTLPLPRVPAEDLPPPRARPYVR